MPTTEGVVQLPVDGPGKQLRAQTGGTMPAGTYAEVLVLQDPDGALVSPAQDGADGAGAPANPGTGIRGWLRGLFEISSRILSGSWGYHAGVSGTVNITGRVLGVAAHAAAGGATVSINGGDTIPVPTGAGIALTPVGTLIAPTIVFTGTDSYMVETVT